MIKSACKLMKLAAVSSAALMVAGGLLVLVAQQISLESTLPAIFISLGFFSIIAGLLVLVGTTVAVMLPTVSRRLDLCQH